MVVESYSDVQWNNINFEVKERVIFKNLKGADYFLSILYYKYIRKI